MPRKLAALPGIPVINRWVVDAIEHAGISGSDLARRLHERRVINTPDRSIPSKIARGEREVSAGEVFAIADITGYPAPNEVSASNVMDVPLVAWVSAGAMLGDDVRDEARDILHIADLPPGDWIALEVEGTSMDRVSPPGSRIILNRNDKRLVPNACYVIDDGHGNSTYKRYRPDPDRFEPVSTFDHETLFPENEPRVIGRVRFSILPM